MDRREFLKAAVIAPVLPAVCAAGQAEPPSADVVAPYDLPGLLRSGDVTGLREAVARLGRDYTGLLYGTCQVLDGEDDGADVPYADPGASAGYVTHRQHTLCTPHYLKDWDELRVSEYGVKPPRFEQASIRLLKANKHGKLVFPDMLAYMAHMTLTALLKELRHIAPPATFPLHLYLGREAFRAGCFAWCHYFKS